MSVLLKRSLVLAALFAGMTGTQVYAQDTIIAKVPFDFVVDGHTFHSGRYEVKMEAAVRVQLGSARKRTRSGWDPARAGIHPTRKHLRALAGLGVGHEWA